MLILFFSTLIYLLDKSRNKPKRDINMLRKIRVTLAIVFYVLVTLLFLDFTGTIHTWFGWMAKIQFLPAVLALNVVVIVALVVLTLLLGRVYCSVICPLGVFQDIISWISSKRKKKKYRFSYSRPLTVLRWVVLLLFVIALLAGLVPLVALIAPYSSYGRIASTLLAPVYQWGNNLLAFWAERADSYAFYETEVWMKGLPTLIVAVVTVVVLFVLAWKHGRTYCNTICPVGTVLGFLSKYSLFRPVIDTSKCKNCQLCAKKCKAACINLEKHEIDYSRCVACMDCISTCKHGALHYESRFKQKDGKRNEAPVQPDNSRRSFLTVAATVTVGATLKAQEKKVDGGLATIIDKQVPNRQTKILPPGAQSAKHFAQHCTACQLCVSACPNQVLRPSTDLMKFMQPEMSYERGYCRPECTKCAEVCPTDAIHLTSLADKSSTQIGHAVFLYDNCIAVKDKVSCGNCERHCPTRAIQMVPSVEGDPDSPKIPAVNVERCIGCGACENLCPARPFSAIYVEGHERQRLI